MKTSKTLLAAFAVIFSGFSAQAFDNQKDLANFLDHQDHVEKMASHYAMERSTNPKIKDYASRVYYNHTVANKVLMTLAAQENLSLDKNGEFDQAKKELENLQEQEFDMAYAKLMVAVHERALTHIDASKMLDTTSVGAFAQVVRSRVEDGLIKAREL